MSRARAAFIDRDGVINELVRDPVTGEPESPLQTSDVALVPGAAEALHDLAAAGWRLIGVSNQPAAAKGKVSLEQLQAVQQTVLDLLRRESVQFDDFRLCLHHPEAVVAGLRGSCDCRKPAPGMLTAAAHDLDIDLRSSWMIGDTDADVLAGLAAGCRTVLIDNPASAHKRSGSVRPDGRAPNLRSAAALLSRRSR